VFSLSITYGIERECAVCKRERVIERECVLSLYYVCKRERVCAVCKRERVIERECVLSLYYVCNRERVCSM